MNWSKYSISEKWKIVKSKIMHSNIICVAIHTNDLELFKKILLVENVTIKDFAAYGVVKEEGKYTNFFRELCNYFNDKFFDEQGVSALTLYLEKMLDCIEDYNLLSDKPASENFTKNEQLQPRHSYEETLEYYDSNASTNTPPAQVKVLSKLNYVELDWSN